MFIHNNIHLYIITKYIMSLFGIFKRKSIIQMASPMPTPGIVEASFLAGVGTSAFITVAPLVSSYLGGYFACQTSWLCHW